MADIASLGIRIDANGAIRQTEHLTGKLSTLGTTGEGAAGKLLTAFKLLATGWAAREFIKNTIDAQNAMAQLEAAVASTGGVAGRSVTQLNDLSLALQRTTIYSDEAVKGVQSLLLTFDKIRGSEFDEATRAVTNLAARLGGDLKGAALQVGKALQDPAQGLLALRRSGVSFSEAQQEVIKSLFATNHVAEAQRLILKELEHQFGGSAEAARNTLGGALSYLKNVFGDMFEVSSSASSGIVGAINRIGDALPHVRAAFDAFFGGLQMRAVDAQVALKKFEIRVTELEAAALEAAAGVLAGVPLMAGAAAKLVIAASGLRDSVAGYADGLEKWRQEEYAAILGLNKHVEATRAVVAATNEVVPVAIKAAEAHAKTAVAIDAEAAAYAILVAEISAYADVIAGQIKDAKAKEVARIERTLESIQHTFRDFFVDLFEHGLSSLRGFIDAFKTLFLRMIADILAARVMAKLAGVLGASLGTAGAAGAQSAGGAATGIGAAAGLGTLPLIGIGVAVVAVASIVTGFLNAGKAAREAAKRVREFNEALGEFSNTTATDLERAIAGVRKQAEQLRQQALVVATASKGFLPDLEAYNAAIAKINIAEALRILQLIKAAEALRLAAEQDLQVRLLRATGFAAEADAMAFALEQQREYAKAVLDNADASYLAKLAEVQRAEAIQRTADLEREHARALQDLNVRMAIATGATDEQVESYQIWIAQQREYEDAVRAGRDAVYLATLAEVQRAETIARSMAKVQGVIDGLSNTIAGLQGFADALKLSPASALSPVDRLAEARRQYEAVLAAAKAGDQAAAGRLPGAAQTFLDASQAVNASGAGYAADYARVLADTEATIKLFEDAKSIQQQMLDVLKEQLGVFKGWGGLGIGGGITGDIGGGIRHGPSAADAERMHQEELTEIRASVRLLAVAGEKLDRIDESVNGGTTATRRGFEGLTLLK